MNAIVASNAMANLAPVNATSEGRSSNLPFDPPRNGPLTSQQKAALIIAALGPQGAGPVIENMGEGQLKAFAKAYAQLEAVPKPILQHVVKEFLSGLNTDTQDIKGGFEETKALLNQFIGEEETSRVMEDISDFGGGSVWGKLERIEDDIVSQYLATQNPQLIAVILTRLTTEKASRILDQFETSLSGQVILRLSKPIEPNDEALEKLAKTIERDFLAPLKTKKVENRPGELIGAMMNNVMSEKRNELMEVISSSAPEILMDVRKSMLTFEDLVDRVPPKAIPMAVKEIEVVDFLKAMKFGKGNAPKCVEYVFGNISQRMAKQYEEQMSEMPEVSAQEAEAAQALFMSNIRNLVAAGEVELIPIPTEDDEDDNTKNA